MGDGDLGTFVQEGILQVFRRQLAPLASLVTPNQYELELLTGQKARDEQGLRSTAATLRGMGCNVTIATGCTLLDTVPGNIERIVTPRLPIRPCGTGDLFAGLTAAHLAKGCTMIQAMQSAVARTFAILERTRASGNEETTLLD